MAVMLPQDTVNAAGSPSSPAPTSRVMQLLISPTLLKQAQQQDSGELKGPGAQWRPARPPLQPFLAKHLDQEVSMWDWGAPGGGVVPRLRDGGWSDLGAHTSVYKSVI